MHTYLHMSTCCGDNSVHLTRAFGFLFKTMFLFFLFNQRAIGRHVGHPCFALRFQPGTTLLMNALCFSSQALQECVQNLFAVVF